MENDAPTCTANVGSKRNCKVWSVMNPDDIATPHTIQKWTKEPLKQTYMQCPRELKEILAKPTITNHPRKLEDGFGRKIPRDISPGTNHHRCREVAKNIACPPRDCTTVKVREGFGLSQKMIEHTWH